MVKRTVRYWFFPLVLVLSSGASVALENDRAVWHQVRDARADFVRQHLGPVPDAVEPLEHLQGLWPGGGIMEVRAHKLQSRYGDEARAYLTWGFTNADMPNQVLNLNHRRDDTDEQLDTVLTELPLRPKPPAAGRSHADGPRQKQAGHGYELMVLTEGAAEWPREFLEWVASQEILGNADLLGQVEAEGGVTYKDVRIGDDFANVLIAKAQQSFPSKLELPNGTMHWLVATTVTDDELVWARDHGAEALVNKLQRKGAGQLSQLERSSIIHPEPIEYSKLSSRVDALELYEKGLLRKVYLFPPEFGGEEEDLNAVYLPREAALEKKRVDEKVLRLARQGKITNYGASPQYIGASFIPSAIEIRALGAAGFEKVIPSWEEKPLTIPSTEELYRQMRAEPASGSAP